MGTFQRTETVDARQFTGGKENGANLALWVNSNGQLTETRAEWHQPVNTGNPMTSRPEFVYIRTYNWREHVYLGDWVIFKQDGTFDHMRHQDFNAAGYIQV
jgi:hypothetical protein